MALKVGSAVVGVKAESTAYTFDAPGTANDFPAYDITVAPESEDFDNPETSGNYGKLDGQSGPGSAEISFKVLLRGQAATGPITDPHMTTALQACGLAKANTGTPVDTMTYTPVNTFDGTGGNPDQAYSVAAFIDGTRYAIKGAMGNLVLTWRLGQPIEAAFSFKGAWVARADVALPTPAGVSTAVPPAFLGAASFQVQSYGAVVETVSVDLGNVVTQLRDAKDTNGVLGYEISDRRISGTMTVQDTLVATHDWFGKWRAGTTGNLTTGAIGSAAGNKWNFTAARIQYRAPSPGDRDKIATLELPFSVNIAGGGAEGSDFSLVHT